MNFFLLRIQIWGGGGRRRGGGWGVGRGVSGQGWNK